MVQLNIQTPKTHRPLGPCLLSRTGTTACLLGSVLYFIMEESLQQSGLASESSTPEDSSGTKRPGPHQAVMNATMS